MRTKLLSFKPLKNGETTVYLDKGINLHSLVDMQGQEIDIGLAMEKVIDAFDEATKTLFAMILDYANRRYEQGKAEGDKEYLDACQLAKTGITE